MEEYKLSAKDIIRAIQLDPYDKMAIKHRDWLVKKLVSDGYDLSKNQNHKEALGLLNYAALLNPENPHVYYRRGRILSEINQMTLAANDLKKSITLDPANFQAYAMLDWVLEREGKYDEIVRYWDAFIKINPGNSSAYVERGGAYYHSGDYNKTVKNAKIAADMGNPLGIEAYEKFKHLVSN